MLKLLYTFVLFCILLHPALSTADNVVGSGIASGGQTFEEMRFEDGSTLDSGNAWIFSTENGNTITAETGFPILSIGVSTLQSFEPFFPNIMFLITEDGKFYESESSKPLLVNSEVENSIPVGDLITIFTSEVTSSVNLGDNLLIRGDGATKGIQNSGITIDDVDNMNIPGVLTATTFVGALTGNSDTVTTNANLTGVITSSGNATSITSQTGTGTKFVVDTSPTLVTPEIGVATGTSLDLGGTTLYASRQITVDTGGVFNIALSGASGDDFTVDTDKFVVEGDTGNVGILMATPERNLQIGPGIAGFINTTPNYAIQIVSDTASQEVAYELMVREDTKNRRAKFFIDDDTGKWGLEGSASSGGVGDFIISTSAAIERFRITNTGSVLIGTATTNNNPLSVNRSNDGIIVDFESADIVEGNISISGNDTSYNAFVGSHYTQLKDGQVEPPRGAVMISTGEIISCSVEIESEVEVSIADAIDIVLKADAISNDDIEVENKDNVVSTDISYQYDPETDTEKTITKKNYGKKTIKRKRLKSGVQFNDKTREFYSVKAGYRVDKDKAYQTVSNVELMPGKEYFVYVDTTTIAGDKRVYGTWFGKMSDNAKGMSFGDDNKAVYLVAQVGLYKIRVTDTNGNINNGDYLETSTRAMEAQKQTSNAKLNSTIGKAEIAVDFSTIDIDPILGYKWTLIPLIF